MFTKLLLASSAIGALSAPVANYQHTTQEGNVNITYQYETNEVNSIDDLVVGNVYHFSVDSSLQFNLDDLSQSGYIDFYIINGYCSFYCDNGYSDETILPIILKSQTEHVFEFEVDAIQSFIGSSTDNDNYSNIYFENVYNVDFDFDFVLEEYDTLSNTILYYISASDYNVITNVQEVYHTGLFGNLADFLRYHIYGGIPHVNEITFDIAGNTTTMLDWLVITTSIALAVVALVLLFLFFKFILKIFSNAFMLR